MITFILFSNTIRFRHAVRECFPVGPILRPGEQYFGDQIGCLQIFGHPTETRSRTSKPICIILSQWTTLILDIYLFFFFYKSTKISATYYFETFIRNIRMTRKRKLKFYAELV